MESSLIIFTFILIKRRTLLKNYDNLKSYLFIISEKYIILFIIRVLFIISEKGRATVTKGIDSIANNACSVCHGVSPK